MLGAQNRKCARRHAEVRAAGAKKAIQDIYNAEDRDHAEVAIKTFALRDIGTEISPAL